MRNSRLSGKKRLNVRILIFLVPVLLATIFLVIWFGGIRTIGNRMTVVLVGDPVIIVSWDKSDGTFLLVSLPAHAVVDSVHGYGQYSLESLWKLGSMEGREGTVLSQSIEELLGVPVPFYVGGKNHVLVGRTDPLSLVKSIFSLPAIPSFFRGKYTSNMTPSEFLMFAWAFSQRKPDTIKMIDLTKTLVPETLPDGSHMSVADTNGIDQTLGNAFEDAGIRKEGLSVAVFNTTPVPSLGTRVSRMFTHAGMLVVLVGNDRPTIGACSITGGNKELKSRTAAFIIAQYGCRKVEGAESRADLTVRIGTEYQSRFVPFTAK